LFSFAVPITHLKDFEPYQDFTFGLSFLLDNPEYESYFARKCNEGFITYLDNSFNETLVPATPHQMAELYKTYHPTCVVSPDADWWDPSTTFAAFNKLSTLISTTNILAIFRSDDERRYFRAHSEGATAVSYWWVDRITQIGLDQVHFLGLGKISTVLIHKPPTLDTSQMVKMAMRGLHFNDWVAAGGVLEKHLTRESGAEVGNRLKRAQDFFSMTLDDKTLELAAANMLALKAYANR
jgi:hypothetical protein